MALLVNRGMPEVSKQLVITISTTGSSIILKIPKITQGKWNLDATDGRGFHMIVVH